MALMTISPNGQARAAAFQNVRCRASRRLCKADKHLVTVSRQARLSRGAHERELQQLRSLLMARLRDAPAGAAEEIAALRRALERIEQMLGVPAPFSFIGHGAPVLCISAGSSPPVSGSRGPPGITPAWQEGKKAGFTLIELLVVIAIIGVLAAMLMPALNKAREMANRAKCTAQQKQIGIQYQIYANDWNECLPPSHDEWVNFANDYVKVPQMFRCPSDKVPKYEKGEQIQILTPAPQNGKDSLRQSYSFGTGVTMKPGQGNRSIMWDLYAGWDNPIAKDFQNHGTDGGNVGYRNGESRWVKREEWVGPNDPGDME